MNYCGIAVGQELQQLCVLRETRADEPPIRLEATFYEPGSPAEVVEELTSALDDVVVAIGSPQSEPFDERERRACDASLWRRGVTPRPLLDTGLALYDALEDLGVFDPEIPEEEPGPDGDHEAIVEEGAFHEARVFEVNADGVFCALQGRRVPARRHPLGVLIRLDELVHDGIDDPGGDLWSRRIEEIEAAAAALCAHRYAVGHAAWLGDPDEGVVVLPGSYPPEVFSAEGVVPHVPRARLAGARDRAGEVHDPPGGEF